MKIFRKRELEASGTYPASSVSREEAAATEVLGQDLVQALDSTGLACRERSKTRLASLIFAAAREIETLRAQLKDARLIHDEVGACVARVEEDAS